MQKSWPSKRDCGALTWIPGAGSQIGERKRQGEDEQEPRPLNKCFKPSTLDDEEGPKPPGHLFDQRATDVSQTSLSLETPKVSLVDLTANGMCCLRATHHFINCPCRTLYLPPLQFRFSFSFVTI